MSGVILSVVGLVMSLFCLALSVYGREEAKEHNDTQSLLWLILAVVAGK